jgi:hypothetical protein
VRDIYVDGKDFSGWIGPEFESAAQKQKLLVLGESRYDEEFTDREIIKARIAGELSGLQRRTFVNFELAVLEREHSDADMRSFWNRTVFYNYIRKFFPGGPRVRPSYQMRVDPLNVETLRTVLHELKPTHAIVWGLGNWDEIDAGSPWTPDECIVGTQQKFCSTTIDGNRTLFTRVSHPSAGFSSRFWAPVLSSFLSLSRPDAAHAVNS